MSIIKSECQLNHNGYGNVCFPIIIIGYDNFAFTKVTAEILSLINRPET